MTGKRIWAVLVVFGLGAAVMSGCAADRNEYRDYRKQQELAQNTPPFQPAYYKDSQRRHVAVFFDVTDGTLVLSSRPAQLRPGTLPYRSATAGNVLIVYKDVAGKEIGRYAIEDPVLARSCDSDKGAVGELKRIPGGVIEVLLPDNPAIAHVEIGRFDGKRNAFDISSQIKARRDDAQQRDR